MPSSNGLITREHLRANLRAAIAAGNYAMARGIRMQISCLLSQDQRGRDEFGRYVRESHGWA